MPRLALVLLLLAAAAGPAMAIGGRVVDADGKPIEEAEVCLVVGTTEHFCTQTSSDGYFRLPVTPASEIRIQAAGFLARRIEAVHHGEPIRLEVAASVLVRVRDASTGEPLERARVWIIQPNGRRRGPVPANKAGVRVGSLPAGLIRIEVGAEGYHQEHLGEAMLIRGKQVEVVVRMTPGPPPEPEPDPAETGASGENGS